MSTSRHSNSNREVLGSNPSRGTDGDKMKFEKIDAACIVLALFFIAAYLKLGTQGFLYVSAALLIPVIYFQVRGRERKQPHAAEAKTE